jgi:hypothetical protein
MAWTQADADAVRAAIVALATGKRVVTVEYAGPPQRSVTYAAAQLPELQDLLGQMTASLNTAPGYRIAVTRKGL